MTSVFRILRQRLFMAAVIASSACGPTRPTQLQVPAGIWGGDHAQLTVSDAAATIEFDCARGSLDAPLVLDRNGRFDVAGIFVRGHGGPVQVDEVPEQESARYTGIANGHTMTLTVALTTSRQSVGTFELVLGRPARLVRCL